MRFFLKATVCVSILVGSLTSGYAQDNSPRTLSPRKIMQEEQEIPDVTPVPVKTISGGINVRSLDSVDKEALGVLSGSQAFPADMWSQSERTFVEALITDLPAQPSAPYLRILQRRLLLSAAQPPQGSQTDISLLALRAKKLADMGQVKDVISLIRSAPQNERQGALQIQLAEAHLLDDNVSEACALAATGSQESSDPFWIKTLAFCRLLAKQNDRAMLSLNLLRDGGDNDPVFYRLMEGLNAGERPNIENLPAPKPLQIALIKASQAILSDDIRNSNDPLVLSMLTKAGHIEATQKAVELNLASADFLRKAFLNVKFTADELANPLDSAEKLDTLKAQALLYQVSSQDGQLPVVQSETIALAFELANKDGNFFSIARLYSPMIAQLPRGIDMLWFAPQAMRALLGAGDWESAKSWYLMLRNAAFSDSEAAKHWIAIRPLAVLAGFDVAQEAVHQTLTDWWAAQEKIPQSYQKAALLFSIIDGMGLNVAATLWLDMIQGPKLTNGQSPKTGLWIKMNEAADQNRLGETVLMALLAFDGSKAAQMDSTFLHDVLEALRTVGLERDARAVAVETLLQTGF